MSVALASGTFDGLHLGHQAVLRALRRRALEASLPAAVVTFEPHPLDVLRPGGGPCLLSERAEKIALLAELGVDLLHILHFTPEFARIEADAFVRDVLVGQLGCRVLVAGEDHRFGHGRAAGSRELAEFAAEVGLSLEIVPRVMVAGAPVSSTRARQALATGELDLAARLLGRPYGVLAPAVRGAGRGRALGYPTVNLRVGERKQMPPEGIYACRATIHGRTLPAAVHWGGRPTFDEPERVLEAHLLGHSGDLYGEWVELAFIERLRPVVEFDGVEALVRAIEEDLGRTAEIARRSPALQPDEGGRS